LSKKKSKNSKYRKSKRFDNRDLSWTTLNKDDYSYCRFPNVIFGQKDLSNKNFKKINAYRAKFSKSKLTNCNFRAASLKFTDFSFCDLTNSDFTGANLFHTNFYKSNLTNTKFNGAKIRKTSFKDAILEGSTLEKKSTQSKID